MSVNMIAASRRGSLAALIPSPEKMLPLLSRVRGENARDHAAHALAGGNVQELVRAVRVGMRTQHAGDQELRLREFRAEHAHERDAAALADIRRWALEERARRSVDRLLEPWRKLWRVPAGARLFQLDADLRAVRRIGFEQLLQRLARLLHVGGRRHAQA